MKLSEAFTKTSFYARWLAEGHLSSWFFVNLHGMNQSMHARGTG